MGDNAISVLDELDVIDESDVEEGESGGTDEADTVEDVVDATRAGRPRWRRLIVPVAIAVVVPGLIGGAGYLLWQNRVERDAVAARTASMKAAAESTVAMLSYQPDTVEKDLGAARDRLTGAFKDSYTKLVNDVVIPGARQQKISAVATVPGTSWVSTTENHAVVLVFVDQTTIIGDGAPTSTATSVRVTLERSGDRWLISDFTPV